MRIGTIALAIMVLVSSTSRIEAGPPHGGGHAAPAPKPPHFSPPPAPNFSQPNMSHANTAHMNAINQGGLNAGHAPGAVTPAGYYRQPRHSTASSTKTTTRLHNLSNALQAAHASMTGQTGSAATPAGQSSVKSTLSVATAGTSSASSTPAGQSSIKSTSSLATAGTSSTSSTPAGPSAVSGTSAVAGSGTIGTPATVAGQSAVKGTTSLASTTTNATPARTAFSTATTGANLPSNIGSATGTAASSSTGSTTTVPATNPTGWKYRMTPAYLSLMSELYGPYGLPHYNPINYGRHRYYGSSYYGIRNNNNSMYFAQMRRVSRLANDLNTLNGGSGVSTNVAAGVSTNMTSRIRGDLIGVVVGNGTPPYQTVHQLAAGLVTHLPNRTTPMMNTGQLARDLMVVMNGSGNNVSQIQSAIGSAHSLLNMSGVHQQGIQTIVNDMGMVATWGNGLMR